MTDPVARRNPYLILGLPFGASRAEANAAFVRLARRARRGGGDLTELTWALHEIDEAAADAAAGVGIFRIPADPAPFAAPTGAVAASRTAAAEHLRALVRARAERLAPPEP